MNNHTPARGSLRLADLKERRAPASSRLMNVKLPAHTVEAIDEIASRTQSSKTEVVVALLNEGLAVYERRTIVARAIRGRPAFRVGVVVLLAMLLAAPARGEIFVGGQAFIPGKGGHELADFIQSVDFWGPGGQFMAEAQACSTTPYTTTHVDGTQGLYNAAFNQYDCGCGLTTFFGCDSLLTQVTPTYCTSGPSNPARYWNLKQEGVAEQLWDFINANGITALEPITYSMGGNVLRAILSNPNLYDQCAFASPPFPQCQVLRAHLLQVINAIDVVIALHAPFMGSEAADYAIKLATNPWTGWLAELLNPPDQSTKDCTTARMATLNKGALRGAPGVPFLTATARGEPLHVPRWIPAGLSQMKPSQVTEDGAHVQDQQMQALQAFVAFTTTDPGYGRNDGLVSLPSMAYVFTNVSDRWWFTGQHDVAANVAGVSGFIGNNHFHGSNGIGPRYWYPTFLDVGGASALCQSAFSTGLYGINTPLCGCQLPANAQVPYPIRVCPDGTCKNNALRGYPTGADVGFAIGAFFQQHFADVCGPAINYQNVYSGRCCPIVNRIGWNGTTPIYGITGCQPYYYNYAPSAGNQVCNSRC